MRRLPITRRSLVSRAFAGASGFALAGAAAGSGSLPLDPVPELVAQRFRLWAECDERVRGQNENTTDRLVEQTRLTTDRLERLVAGLVPTGGEGLIAQVRLFREWHVEQTFHLDERDQRLTTSLIAGISRLTGAPLPGPGAWAWTGSEAQPGSDAALLAAERQIEALRAESDAYLAAHPREDADSIWNRIWALEDRIANTAPESLVGAAVKLRRLTDPDLGLEAGEHPRELPSLRQVLVAVEREAARLS